jgi:hypothetical protein
LVRARSGIRSPERIADAGGCRIGREIKMVIFSSATDAYQEEMAAISSKAKCAQIHRGTMAICAGQEDAELSMSGYEGRVSRPGLELRQPTTETRLAHGRCSYDEFHAPQRNGCLTNPTALHRFRAPLARSARPSISRTRAISAPQRAMDRPGTPRRCGRDRLARRSSRRW